MAISRNGLRAELVKGAAGSFTLKLGRALFLLSLGVLLARFLGPREYGIYTFALSVVTILGLPANMGLPMLLVREVARYQYANNHSLLHGLILRSNQVVLIFSALIVVIGGVVVWIFADSTNEKQWLTFAWALPLVPLLAMSQLRGAIMRGLRYVISGQVPEMLILPGMALLLIGAGTLAGGLSSTKAMALYSCAALITLVASTVMLSRVIPQEVHSALPSYDHRSWARSILPLSLVTGLGFINGQVDIVMLGLFTTKESVGLYRVAFQGAALVIFTLEAVNMAVMPHISRLYHAGEHAKLQRMVTLSAWLTLVSALPVAVVFIFFGEPVLALLFGDSFRAAYSALAILCFAQLLRAGMGSVGPILNMTGHEHETLKGVAVAALANIILNAIFIPFWGAEGAAAASAITIVIWSVLLSRAVFRHLGIHSSVYHVKAGVGLEK